jgi:hypothetical protein
VDEALQPISVECHEGWAQEIWGSIPRDTLLCQEGEERKEAGQVGGACASRSLLFPKAIPFSEANNELVMLIDEDYLVAIPWPSFDPANTRQGGQDRL